MSIYTDLLDAAFPFILSAVKQLADAQVDGAELGKDQKKIIYAAYVVLKMYGPELAEKTTNPYDDKTIAALLDFAEDTLSEAGIELPEVSF